VMNDLSKLQEDDEDEEDKEQEEEYQLEEGDKVYTFAPAEISHSDSQKPHSRIHKRKTSH
jgi:hypothetical protein